MRDPLSEWIPEPTVVLLGCRPWSREAKAPCPVCGGAIRPDDRGVHCARCDRSHPSIESRCRGVLIGIKAKDAQDRARAEFARDLKRRRLTLTERERRRLWNGYVGGILAPNSRVNDRVRIAREWLASVGMLPDWSLVLDRRGNVVGRVRPEAEAGAVPA
jgi:hypothetical protein